MAEIQEGGKAPNKVIIGLITNSDPTLHLAAIASVLRPYIAREIIRRRPTLCNERDIYKTMVTEFPDEIFEELLSPTVEEAANRLEDILREQRS